MKVIFRASFVAATLFVVFVLQGCGDYEECVSELEGKKSEYNMTSDALQCDYYQKIVTCYEGVCQTDPTKFFAPKQEAKSKYKQYKADGCPNLKPASDAEYA
eukprot:TRINITY_DN18599_c0_g1_i2.p1 TRINITY_DN18599_c0_g1~~TRINITY_DN18599_c0_g1_i2.p1  ORF type:complete len:102 (-),score=25.76 TRINITY_DN18599_c0_g1_i2:842-1147(-)